MFVFGKVIILFLGVWMAAAQQSQGDGHNCTDETICEALIAATPCQFLKLSEQLRCPVACNRCSDLSGEAERTTGASVVDTTSPQSNVTSFPETTLPPSTCPDGCVDAAVMQRWLDNYRKWLDDYKTWKEQFIRYKTLADQGRACGG
uniref:uncharacterized protein LOC101242154 n=1 Tax=Ciona intestinalis TaxID=7719 RepID=UPI00089DB3A8|nr:uncharacterized protein LOC101242154 [Ciona intestinalis]XP_026693310.1 uncharacterized protein LOC101242154 [Ciona intestinalis]|eukprot:XP_018670340.1 uncharacterized protein LOC101242154 [Ciona intestinalis]